MTFCLNCYCGGGGGEIGVVAEAFYVPLSQLLVCGHQCHDKSSFLILYSQQEHGLWIYTWFLATA